MLSLVPCEMKGKENLKSWSLSFGQIGLREYKNRELKFKFNEKISHII